MSFTEMFNAVKKDAQTQAQAFFKKYVEVMAARKVEVTNLQAKSATLVAPNGIAVDTYVLCEQDSWTDGVATFKSSIFIRNEKGQVNAVDNTKFTFNEADYK